MYDVTTSSKPSQIDSFGDSGGSRDPAPRTAVSVKILLSSIASQPIVALLTVVSSIATSARQK